MKKLKSLNWTAIITWSVIGFIAYNIFKFLYKILFV